ncbi:MAG: Phosphotransferase system, phosphocarrier protein HPr [Chthoniobacteraceae bacterium]|nr:Phosphotransferase system, phosphocarrier protein HPr [Chthoniobacteraceae bacterium]
MKRITVIIPWREGLHLRPAARLVKLSQRFRSSIRLVCGAGIADTRSIFGIVALCAAMGTQLDLEANGDDEQEAIQAMEAEFAPLQSDVFP